MILLVSLNYKDNVARYVQLLEHKRPEVFVTAAWGLRVLAVESTLPGMFAYANKAAQLVQNAAIPKLGIPYDHQLGHLYETFGQLKYAPSQSLLKTFIPKNLTCVRSRRAAIWALGWIFEGNPDNRLSGQLISRAADASTFNPEDVLVRRMAAISVGRMKANDRVKALRNVVKAEGRTSQVGYACAWAINQLTGEKLPKLEARDAPQSPWFLVPVKAD